MLASKQNSYTKYIRGVPYKKLLESSSPLRFCAAVLKMYEGVFFLVSMSYSMPQLFRQSRPQMPQKMSRFDCSRRVSVFGLLVGPILVLHVLSYCPIHLCDVANTPAEYYAPGQHNTPSIIRWRQPKEVPPPPLSTQLRR